MTAALLRVARVQLRRRTFLLMKRCLRHRSPLFSAGAQRPFAGYKAGGLILYRKEAAEIPANHEVFSDTSVVSSVCHLSFSRFNASQRENAKPPQTNIPMNMSVTMAEKVIAIHPSMLIVPVFCLL